MADLRRRLNSSETEIRNLNGELWDKREESTQQRTRQFQTLVVENERLRAELNCAWTSTYPNVLGEEGRRRERERSEAVFSSAVFGDREVLSVEEEE